MNFRPILHGAACCLSACSAALLLSACVATDVEGASGRHLALTTPFGCGAALILSLIAAHRWRAALGAPWAGSAIGRHRLRHDLGSHKVVERFPTWTKAAPAARELAPQGSAPGLHLLQVEISHSRSRDRTPAAGTHLHHPMNRMSVAFYWQWESMRPQPDPMMTRERAAKLLRSWRRATTQGERVFKLKCVREDGTRAYLVQHVPTGERGGLYIKPAAGATSRGFAPAPEGFAAAGGFR